MGIIEVLKFLVLFTYHFFAFYFSKTQVFPWSYKLEGSPWSYPGHGALEISNSIAST